MRWALPYIAVVMVYMMTPAAGELAENAVHLFTEGHTAHALSDQDHEPSGDEHGCSGSFHVCSCHGSIGFVLAPTVPVPGEARPRQTDGIECAPDALAPGHQAGVFRPPIARLYS